VKLVTSVGPGIITTRSDSGGVITYGTGPYSVSPAIPNVDVATPSIERDRKLVSSR
jgi:hypothetical protein